MALVYILHCADGSYYTGLTRGEEPEQRLSEHQMKLSPSAFTASRLPVRLVYSEYFDLVVDAIAAERKDQGLVARQEGGADQSRLELSSGSFETARRYGQRLILADPSRPHAEAAASRPQREDI
jgi:putative endonuclease